MFFDVLFSNPTLEQSIKPDELGSVQYGIGTDPDIQEDSRKALFLESVTVGNSFARDHKGNLILSPALYLTKYWEHRDDAWSIKQYVAQDRFHKEPDTAFIVQERDENEAFIFNKQEELVFKVKWELEEKESIIVYHQTHVPTGIVKTLRAPVRVDRERFEEAVFSRPPYGKERIAGKDRLVVPWRNIDRIVGASLSYSYPPPAP